MEKSPEIAEEAMRLGLADRIVGFEEGIAEADLVVLAITVLYSLTAGHTANQNAVTGHASTP